MRVESIGCYNSKNYRPKFRGVSREVRVGDYFPGKVKHRNTSWMFRPAVEECKRFYNFLTRVFKNVSKVNVYSLGCSIGYEAYSFVMGMYANRKERNPEKYMPVIAKDYDEVIIKSAKEHLLPLEHSEVKRIRETFNYNDERVKEFIKFVDSYNIDNELWDSHFYEIDAEGDILGIPTDKLLNNVEFSIADIRSDYVNLAPQNSVAMVSNIWPYIEDEERIKLAANLYNRFEKRCFVKIDEFDEEPFPKTSELLMDAGFKPTPIEYLFKK